MIAAVRRFLILLVLLAAAPGAVRAQLATPVVAKPLPDLTVPAGTAQTGVNLKKTFALDGVTGSVVRFTTSSGVIDVALTPDVAPATVANFLNYVNRGAYAGTFLHRLVKDFIVQGGGYSFTDTMVNPVPADPPVVNEFNVSNTRGTIAMAKLGSDPNSATTQWFFNLADNSSNLDNQNGGFTVFGHVISQAGLNVMDAIAALPVLNAGSPFDQLPVHDYTDGATVGEQNLVLVNSVQTIPLAPKGTSGKPSLLKLAVNRNTNPGLVTTTLTGTKLILKYQTGQTGEAVISVRAKYPGAGKVVATFKVTVQ